MATPERAVTNGDGVGPGLDVVEGGASSFAGRPPVWSKDAEREVLGAMLLDPAAVSEAVDVLGDGGALYKRSHRILYGAFYCLHQRGQPATSSEVEDELRAREQMEAVGGPQELAMLAADCATSARVEAAARTVAEKGALRDVQERCREIVGRCFEAGPGEGPEVVEEARAALEEIEAPGTLADVDMVSLAEFLDDPDALRPPERVAHGILYRGNCTLAFADPKGGKTTTSIAVAAAVSSGTRFMSRPTLAGRVLYVAAEGDRREILRRLHEFGADPDNVDVVVPSGSPVAELRTLMDARNYVAVVLDTLGRWMAPLDVDRWKQSDVDTVLTPLERIIRASGASLLALHHTNTEGKPIDSMGFAAWADVLRKVEDGQGPRERKVTGRARFPVPDLRFRLVEDGRGSRLVPVDPDREMEERVLEFLEATPGAGKGEIRSGVSGSRKEIDRAVSDLEERGFIDVDRSGIAHTHQIRENPQRQRVAKGRQGDSQGGAGNGGGSLGDGVERDHRSLHGRQGPPSRQDDTDAEETNRCDCGQPIGPTSTTCGSCKREDA